MDFKKESLENLKEIKDIYDKEFKETPSRKNEIRYYLSNWQYYEKLSENLSWKDILRKTRIKEQAKGFKEKYIKLFNCDVNGLHNEEEGEDMEYIENLGMVNFKSR